MRLLFAAAAAAWALTSGPAFAAGVEGLWKTETNDEGKYLHVRIAPCGNKLCGTIEGAFGGADESVVGKKIIWDMEPDGKNEWDDGTIWAPDDDETYSAGMELEGNVLEVYGCVMGGLICRGQDWTRVE